MKIQVQLYLPDQNQGTVWGYGTITLDQLLTFQIRILTCEKGAGIKEAFVSPGGDPDGNHKRFVSSQNRSLASAGVSTREEDSSCGRSNDLCPWGYGERNSVKTREIWGVLPYAAILQ